MRKLIKKKGKSIVVLWMAFLILVLFAINHFTHIDLYAKRYVDNYIGSLWFGPSKWRSAETSMCYLNYLSRSEPSLGEIWHSIPHNIVTESIFACSISANDNHLNMLTFLAKMGKDIYRMIPSKKNEDKKNKDIEILQNALIYTFKVDTNKLKYYNRKKETEKALKILEELSNKNNRIKNVWQIAKK